MGAAACRVEQDQESLQPAESQMCCFAQKPHDKVLEVKTESYEVDNIKPVDGDIGLGPLEGEFNVMLDKDQDNRTLGVDLCFLDARTARIIRILEGGAVASWNKKCPKDKRVLEGDHIVEVNKIRGDVRRLREHLIKDNTLSLMMKRPSKFTISMKKGQGLGIDVDTTPDGKSLFIRNIISGAVHDWNKQNEGAVQVRKGDRIVEVNDTRGLHVELAEAIKSVSSDKQLTLVLSRIFPS